MGNEVERPKTKLILTPSFAPYKVVILSLIAAYCAGVLPKKTHRPLLATIVKYIEGPSSRIDTAAPVDLPSLDRMIAALRKACLDSNPINGEQHAKEIEKTLVHSLWSLKSLDSMHTFINQSRSLLVKSYRDGKTILQTKPRNETPHYVLTKGSFLGKFVIECSLAFEYIEFDQIDILWKSFIDFRNSSISQYTKKYSQLASDIEEEDAGFTQLKKSLDVFMHRGDFEEERTLMISETDLSKLVEYQVHVLENYGTCISQEMKDALKSMTLSESGKVPSIHYINYLECLTKAEYEGAFYSLHRYFDYMMSNRQMIFYHYALLCLASLYATFNCDSEAIRALKESIDVARENKDTSCLQFLLSWLFNFLRDRPSLQHNFYVSSDQLLQFLKANSVESSPLIHCAVYQSETTQLMVEGGPLSSSLESLNKSAFLSLTDLNKSSALASHCALSSALWLRSGVLDLANVYSEVPLVTETNVEQEIGVSIRKAHLKFVCNEVDEAFKVLDGNTQLASTDIRRKKELTGHKLLLLSEQCIRCSRYKMAEIYLNRLSAQGQVNIDMQGQLNYLEVLLQLKIGNIHKAYQAVSNHISTFAKKSSNKYWFIAYTLLNCEILAESPAPSRALSIVIKSLQSALRSGFTLLLLSGILTLCHILQALNQDQDVISILYDCLPIYEQINNHELNFKAHQFIAKSLIQVYDSTESSKQVKIDRITKIVGHLETSIDGFKKMSMVQEVKRCLELQIELGQKIKHQDIIEHAQSSLVSANERIRQEMAVQN